VANLESGLDWLRKRPAGNIPGVSDEAVLLSILFNVNDYTVSG